MSLVERVQESAHLSTEDVNDRPRLQATVTYLERNNVEALLQGLLADILEELPADPRGFLLSKLRSIK